MDSLNDILSRKNFDQPDEIKIIKNYVQQNFGLNVKVLIREHEIIISNQSAGLMSTLRMRGPELARLCQTDKKLVFRIG